MWAMFADVSEGMLLPSLETKLDSIAHIHTKEWN
jgi:hypothetical protein